MTSLLTSLLLAAHFYLPSHFAANPAHGCNRYERWSALFIACISRLLPSGDSASHICGLAATCLVVSKVVYQAQAVGGTGQMFYM